MNYTELRKSLQVAEFTPSGIKDLSVAVKKSIRLDGITEFFRELGLIARNSGGLGNALAITKHASDMDTLKAVRKATQGLGDKTALMVRLGGERVIKVFGRLFQKLVWLVGAILTGLLTLLQILLLFIAARSGRDAHLQAASSAA